MSLPWTAVSSASRPNQPKFPPQTDPISAQKMLNGFLMEDDIRVHQRLLRRSQLSSRSFGQPSFVSRFHRLDEIVQDVRELVAKGLSDTLDREQACHRIEEGGFQ